LTHSADLTRVPGRAGIAVGKYRGQRISQGWEAKIMKQEADGNKRTADGKRKRRHSPVKAKREWYAKYRAIRFAKHFGF
jgi:hypothetical protein